MLSKRGFQTVTLDALVVGALRSWDPANDETLRSLGVNRRYPTLFKNLCTLSAIQGSRRIWSTTIK